MQNVGLLAKRAAAFSAGRGYLAAHHDLHTAITEPGWDTMAPPQLTRDTPVVDVVHPLEVPFLKTVRDKLDPATLDSFDCRFRQRRNVQEPLDGDLRLDDRRTPIALADAVLIVFNLGQIAVRLQLFKQLLPAGKTIHARVRARLRGHLPIVVDDTYPGKRVTEARLIVVRIMGGSDLYDARSKRSVDKGVRNDRKFAMEHGQNDALPHQVTVAFVF